jgi:PleD family two-component response regulator
MRSIQSARRCGLPLPLMLTDIDQLEEYSLVCDHKVLDEILLSMAHSIQTNVCSMDIFTRYGEKQFGVILVCDHFDPHDE